METKTATTLCPCCMETHEQQIKRIVEENIFQEQHITYEAEYTYCPTTDEYYATEQQMRVNDIAMKDAYRKAIGRLTSSEIAAIRAKYNISQMDFAKVLGFGDKTVTRYESFQVQTEVNDSIMRKVGTDPAWFLELLSKSKSELSATVYEKCKTAATEAFAEESDGYQRNALASEQARFGLNGIYHGQRALDLNKLIDAINYLASNKKVRSLYAVKLMKMLWYSDFLCFKRFLHSLTGLAYQALPMGAVPSGYQNIMELDGICCEVVDVEGNTGYHFVCDEGYIPRSLTDDEIRVLDTVIGEFGGMPKAALIERMHKEDAYKMTNLYGPIAYTYANALSID